MKPLLEVCCGSYEDVYAAKLAKADRVELNSALALGGLTPGLGTFLLAKQTGMKIICMVRPRGSGFFYSEKEVETMMEEAKLFLMHGADGIAFGFLNEDFTIDVSNTKKMVELIHSYKKEAVFHRAFDCVSDMDQAMQTLLDCKVDRVLTSGLKPNVTEGLENLTYLQKTYGHKIEILAGCGVKKENCLKILEETNIHQLHSSCKYYQEDPTYQNHGVSYGYLKEGEYEAVSQFIATELKETMNQYHEKKD